MLAAVCVLPTVPAAEGRSADGVQIAAIAFLRLNTIVAYWACAEAIRHITAMTAAVIATLGPVVTYALLAITNAWDPPYVPHEAITLPKILGSLLVVSGVVLAVTTPRR